MEKKVLSLNYEFPGGEVDELSLRSSRSLLDADIIIIEPKISGYNGPIHSDINRLIDKTDSIILKKDIVRRRNELSACLDDGKTIIVYLGKIDEVHVYTGETKTSGTGKNAQTTDFVTPLSPLEILPFNIGNVVTSHGTEIRVGKELGFLSTYWKLFADYSNYKAYIENSELPPLLTTKNGSRILGTIIHQSKGTVIILPKLEYPDSCLDIDNDDEEVWTDEGVEFGKKLLHSIIEIDKAIHQENNITPIPDWVKNSTYQSNAEQEIINRIEKTQGEILKLEKEISDLKSELAQEEAIKNLLFEAGKPLEDAIILSLRILGFSAERYTEGNSEFDSVFASEEGRFLGEAEGKETKAIAIDKFSQLMRNLGEDLKREEVAEPANGVLFGNAYRLSKPEDRMEFFTQKCITSAKSQGIALVRTPDLFWVVKYLKENKDFEYAKKCRKQLLASKGEIVQFPEIPKK